MNIKQKILDLLPDKILLQHRFKKVMGYPLNLCDPQTFNEKLQWLKLHDRKPIYTTMVDKYKAKKYVASIIGDQYIIPTLGVWDRFDDIDFDSLPNHFVLKTTHDSGGVVIVTDKGEFLKDKENPGSKYKKVEEKLSLSLKRNYYYQSREWPYKNVKPRIIAEELISESTPNDYKFFMFNGQMDSVMVCTDRDKGYPKFRFYDKNWNRLKYQKPEIEPVGDVDKPANFETMISLATKLSKGLAHIRVDMFNINGRIFFGELTFFDESGYDKEISEEVDQMWGGKINLSLVRRN